MDIFPFLCISPELYSSRSDVQACTVIIFQIEKVIQINEILF